MKQPLLFLVDLGAIYWLAWHSSNREMAPDEPAEATLSRIRKWRENYRRIAVCLDDPRGTWRHKMYPAYKANRTDRPQAAIDQLKRAISIIKRDKFVIFEHEGMECDDVLASAARAYRGDVLMATPDKDMMQIVDDRVRMLDTMTGNLICADDVKMKWGVEPKLVGDLLALLGDKSDNIPGVPGVGKLIGAELLNKHGSIRGILEALAKDPPKTKKNVVVAWAASILRNVETLALAHSLVALRDDLQLQWPNGWEHDIVTASEAPHAETISIDGKPLDVFVLAESTPRVPDTKRIGAQSTCVYDDEPSSELLAFNAQPKFTVVRDTQPKEETNMADIAPKIRVVQGPVSTPHAFCLTGASGIGKTYFTSGIPNAYFFCVESGLKGANPAYISTLPRYEVCESYDDLITWFRSFRANEAKQRGIRHLVTDSLSGVDKLINAKACNNENVEHMEAKDFKKVWTSAIPLHLRVQRELDEVRKMGIHVWLIAHTTTTTGIVTDTGDTFTKHDLAFQGTGKSLDEVRQLWRQWVDHVLFLDWDMRVKKGTQSTRAVATFKTRILRARETPHHYAKNRADLPPIVPATWRDLEILLKKNAMPEVRLAKMVETEKTELAKIIGRIRENDDVMANELADEVTKAGASYPALQEVHSRALSVLALMTPDEEEEGNDDVKEETMEKSE
jgi:5'-3' exonuclease